jgi:transposase
MKHEYWARTPLPREQTLLFPKRLDEIIPADHLVRVYVEVLADYDWSEWEALYDGVVGQPPIHPRYLAVLWLYGLRRRIGTTRKLEYAIQFYTDFMWLAEGHTPDHTTLSKFRTKFDQPLKDLFRYVSRRALLEGYLQLNESGTDGTRIKANASRYKTWTAEKIDRYLAQLLVQFQDSLDEVGRRDEAETLLAERTPEPRTAVIDDHSSESNEPPAPPALTLEQEALREDICASRELQAQLRAADKARKAEGGDPAKNPAQIPMTDTDSRILPNKEGGYAANYTPLVTAEGRHGFLLDCDVLVNSSEGAELIPSLDRIRDEFGTYPQRVLADGAFATGPNIAAFEEKKVEFLSPLTLPEPAQNPAIRDDPTQPVSEPQWPALPINPQSKTLDKTCFVYDEQADCYRCPLGRELPYDETKSEVRRGERHTWRVYRCRECQGCPLHSRCVLAKSKQGRSIIRDIYTPERERHAAKMRDPVTQEHYQRRMSIAETPFALIKHVMGLRQFLLRGLAKVKTEWRWTCLAVNLDKLARLQLGARLAATGTLATEVL